MKKGLAVLATVAVVASAASGGLIWRLMQNDPVIRRGLTRAGFTGGWLG